MILTHTWTCIPILLLTLHTGCAAESDLPLWTVYSRVGQSADLICKVDGDVKVSQSQWSRCPNRTIAVILSENRFTISDRTYEGRISIKQDHTLTLQRVQEDDFGQYCCKLTSFPIGSLEGRVHLLETQDPPSKTTTASPDTFTQQPAPDPPRNISGTPNTTTVYTPQSTAGLPVMMMVYIGCGSAGVLLLMGITIGLLCRRRKRSVLRNPVNVPHPVGAAPSNHPLVQNPSHGHAPHGGAPAGGNYEDDDDEDEHTYLNITNNK